MSVFNVYCIVLVVTYICILFTPIAGSGGLDDRASMQGSVVLGPEGELINVGGTIRPHMRPSDAVQDIHDANLVPGLRGENFGIEGLSMLNNGSKKWCID